MTFLKRLWFSLKPRTRDTLARAGKTFVQAFVPLVLAAAVLPGVTLAALWAAVIAAAASAASVAWNTVLKPSLGDTIILFPVDDGNTPKQPGE